MLHRTSKDLCGLFPEKRDAYAVVVDNLFTEAECKELIDLTEAKGYDEALLGASQQRNTQQRNSWRCIVDDAALAERIFRQVQPYVPAEWLGCKAVGLNERLRFLKYNPGEYFKPHNDGIYVRKDGSQSSFITVHLYLCDVPEGHGGETTFTTEKMSYGRHARQTSRSDDKNPVKRLSVRPVMGRALIFEHHLPHEGSKLTNGVKYTMRTDVMYDMAGDPAVRTPRWGQKTKWPQYELPEILRREIGDEKLFGD